MIEFEQLFYSLLGGVGPAVVWLLFWLREDKKSPEPRRLVRRTFLLGMLAVLLVIPFQKAVESYLPGAFVLTILLWAALEEIFKFGAATIVGLQSADDDEPIDPLIYMITAALGFVALENTLFIFGLLLNNEITQSIITGNQRFIGASLLHVVASGAIGASLSFSFYRPKLERAIRVILTLVFAIAFHAFFNLVILYVDGVGSQLAFSSVWLGVVLLLLAFERAKRIAP